MDYHFKATEIQESISCLVFYLDFSFLLKSKRRASAFNICTWFWGSALDMSQLHPFPPVTYTKCLVTVLVSESLNKCYASPTREACRPLSTEVKLIAASTKQQVTCSIPPSGPYTLWGGGVVPITSLSLEAALHAHFRVEIKISWLSELPNSRVGKQGRFCNLLWRSLKTWYNLTYRRWFFCNPAYRQRDLVLILRAYGPASCFSPLLFSVLYTSCTFSSP